MDLEVAYHLKTNEVDNGYSNLFKIQSEKNIQLENTLIKRLNQIKILFRP